MKGRKFLLLLSSSLLVFVLSNLAIYGASLKKTAVREMKSVSCGCGIANYSGKLDYSQNLAIFEGKEIIISQLAFAANDTSILGLAHEERWVEIDLSDQKLFAWEGDKLFLESPISSGLPWYSTPTGEFRIWIKLRSAKMEGGSGNLYYYLPNVPYIMYFEGSGVPSWKGYGLHGTYWHNDFGTQRSHGCVNLPTPIAKELYYWTSPVLPEGKSAVWADESNKGTRVVIHE